SVCAHSICSFTSKCKGLMSRAALSFMAESLSRRGGKEVAGDGFRVVQFFKPHFRAAVREGADPWRRRGDRGSGGGSGREERSHRPTRRCADGESAAWPSAGTGGLARA